MFTGIVETLGEITRIENKDSNISLTLRANFTSELKIDQSVAHNGICLTVVDISGEEYTVTAIQETIKKTTIGEWNTGDKINLERGMRLGDRLDGHLVQGHVDQCATCVAKEDQDGSWLFTFKYDPKLGNVTIEKGSITVNGVSLTVVNSRDDQFSVAIIPYTLDHTTFQNIKEGSRVNLEFDVIGKYVTRLYGLR